MKKFKITQGEVNILKACAAIESVPRLLEKSIILEPGVRIGEDPEIGPHMNIALVSKDGSWNDTDLHDYGMWSEFRKGVELTPEGRGEFDFYIRRRGDERGELHGNVTLVVDNGEMSRVIGYGTPNNLRWTREGGFQ